MSLPINQLVYGGVYDNAKRYPQYTFVLSPIDSLCYVNINIEPAQGTGDPSIQPSAYWILFPNVTGDITGVITTQPGLKGGGTTGSVVITNTGVLSFAVVSPGLKNTGTDSDPVVENDGVLSLDGQTGALATKCGQWYKTSDQQIGGTAGPAITTTITFQASTSWTDTNALQWSALNNLWVVNQKGVYHLQAQLNYADMNVPSFGNDTHLININISRGPVTNSPIRTAFDWKDADPTEPDNFVAGIYELQVGDEVQIQVVDHFQNTNQYRIKGQAAAPNDYDYNTFFSWALIKPLP